MKKYSIIILVLLTSCQMASCQTANNKGYIKYQTFDEYKLEGLGHFNIKEPYVLVKKTLILFS